MPAISSLYRTPAAKTRKAISPSGAGSLLTCPLRVAFQSDSSKAPKSIAAPPARLGTICHEVLERAAKGDLAEVEGDDWLHEFEAVWNEAVGNETAQDAKDPKPQNWPYYGMRKAATRRVAREVCLELSDPRIEVAVEESLQTADGTIKGKPDLIIRSPHHEIRDYKTGSILEPDSETPREEYVAQLLLYAVLEYEATGKWPTTGRLVPLEGDDAEIDIDSGTARDLEARVRAAFDRYNSVVSEADPLELANPSAKNCRYCEHSPECPAFWGQVSPVWADAESPVVAASGVILDRQVSKRGWASVTLGEVVGSVSESHITLTGIQPDESFEIWSVMAAVGLGAGAPAAYKVLPQTRVKAI